MTRTATVVTTPIPMSGFVGAYVDLDELSAPFSHISGLLQARRNLQSSRYVPGATVLSSGKPTVTDYFHKVPQASAIERYSFPEREDAPTAQTSDPTNQSGTISLDAFYDLSMTLVIEALKSRFSGNLTTPITLSATSHGARSGYHFGGGCIIQSEGRFQRLGMKRGEAKDPIAPAAWEKWFSRLDECLQFDNGWNGYSAPAPNPLSVEHARGLLAAMRDGSVEPTRVGPTAMGGIAITRRVGHKKAFVECYNDGRVYVLLGNRTTDEMDVRQVDADAQSFQKLVATMREYLNG